MYHSHETHSYIVSISTHSETRSDQRWNVFVARGADDVSRYFVDATIEAQNKHRGWYILVVRGMHCVIHEHLVTLYAPRQHRWYFRLFSSGDVGMREER